MPDPSDLSARRRGERFEHEQAALAAALRGLLGQAESLELVDIARADALALEVLASHRTADEHQCVVEQVWPEAQIERAVEAIHRLATNVGARPT
jgi:hypothetical protein